MNFEWDEDKRESNIKKHGIDFVSVISVFEDSKAIEAYDYLHSTSEDRYQIIGQARPGIVFVVYTKR